jgi:MFS family permease
MDEKNKGPLFLLRALKHRNYRLFFFGQSVSLIGTWMQSIATGWLIYRLTGSAVLLGLVTFVGQIPAFLVAPAGGVIADRWNRHRLIILTQTLAMIQALLLTLLYFTHTLSIPILMVLVAFLGVVNGFDIPIRHSFLLETIDNKNDLTNAIALNSSVFNGARLIGPSIAGVLVATMGEGTCFLINGLSYLAVIAALLAMKINRKPRPKPNSHVLEGFKEGMRYSFGFPPIRAILLIVGLISLIPFSVLLPVFAKTILHGGPQTFGFLVGASGLGAFLGALFLASRPNADGLCRIITLGAIVFGLGLFVFSFSTVLWISMSLMVMIGFGVMVTMSSSNTVLQTIADDDKRGRVMSFYTMAFMGTAPLGSLLGGVLANRIGTPETYMISGLCCIAGAVVFAINAPNLTRFIQNTPNRDPDFPEIDVAPVLLPKEK